MSLSRPSTPLLLLFLHMSITLRFPLVYNESFSRISLTLLGRRSQLVSLPRSRSFYPLQVMAFVLFWYFVPRFSDFGWRICAATIHASASIHHGLSYTLIYHYLLLGRIILPSTYCIHILHILVFSNGAVSVFLACRDKLRGLKGSSVN
jgi:hypothetical protein